MTHEFLKALVIIFAASALLIFLFQRLRMPSLIGFLVSGVVIGPYGLGLIKDTRSVEVLAEIGVILLLFAVGIEFSTEKLIKMRKAVLGGGGAQVLLSVALSALVAFGVTGDAGRSVFVGFLVALSSTAIVLKMLSERGEVDTPHGRLMVGMLIFQDLCVVPFMLLVPALAGGAVYLPDVALTLGKALLIVVAVVFSARMVVPRLLHHVVGTRSRELFIITVIVLSLGIPLLTSRFGLSLALGAFLAGLVISESEYAHQAMADLLPLKESFMGLFFVSVGMLMDLGFVAANLPIVLAAIAAIVALKVLTGTAAAAMTGSPLRASLHAGLGVAQIGEFSFVLATAGKAAGAVTGEFYQIFISSSVATMAMTPFALRFAPAASAWVASRRSLRRLERMGRGATGEGFPRKKQGHVIIVGFGLNGRNLARALREAGVPYAVLEMNSDVVREMKKKGEPIYYGDGTSREILHKLGIAKARLLVVAISDPASARGIVSIARRENPEVHIIVRTRYLAEVDDLKALGADEVIPEEFETSVEIFARALQHYNFPNNVILDMVESVRRDNYTALRSVELPKRKLFERCEWLPDIDLDGYRVPEGSGLVGRSIGGLQVRGRTGATIIAVRRGSEVFANPGPDFEFSEGDIVLFTGERSAMAAAVKYFGSLKEPDKGQQ